MNSLISVIIPTYNRAHCLQRAVCSVFQGHDQNIEVIVVDDGSTDETDHAISLLKKDYPSLITLKKTNGGVSSARNFGVQNSRGEWIAFLDSDDEWLPTRLTSQRELLANNSTLKFVHAEELWVRNGKRVNLKTKHKKSGGDIFERCLDLCLISPSASLINKTLFLELGSFREDFEVCEDYDLWLKLTARYEVGFVENPQVIKYGGHEDQLSMKYPAMDYWRIVSMCDIVKKNDIDFDKRAKALEVLETKSLVLLKGLKKYGRESDCQTVLKMIQDAKIHLMIQKS